MRKTVRRGVQIVGLLTLTGAALAVPGVSAHAATAPQRGGTLTVAVAGGLPDTLDPAIETTPIADQILYSPIFDSLFKYTNGKFEPFLATGYKTRKDGTAVTVSLRRGVKFSDGTPFNAAAVKFNYERDITPANDCTCAAVLKPVTSVTTPGPYTVVYHTAKPYGALISVLSTTTAAYMVSPTAVQKEGVKIKTDPVGAGPYKIVQNTVGSQLVLQRWDGYWDKHSAYLNEIKFVGTSSGTTAYQAVESGTAQMAYGTGIDTPTLKAAKANSKVKILNAPPVGTYALELNTYKAPFNNAKAREAVFLATNTAPIAQTIYGGYADPTDFLSGPGAIPSLPAGKLAGYPQYNLAKAKQLVSQIGGLSFTISPLSADNTSVSTLEALQTEWKAAGIKATIDTSQSGTSAIKALGSGDYQVYESFVGLYPDAQLSMQELLACGSPLNKSFCDKKVTALVEQAGATYSLSKKTALLRQAYAQTEGKDLAWVPLVTEPDAWIESNTLQGVSAQYQVYLDQAWLAG